MACGNADHVDFNVARNIMASEIGASAQGGVLPLGIGTTLSREKICCLNI